MWGLFETAYIPIGSLSLCLSLHRPGCLDRFLAVDYSDLINVLMVFKMVFCVYLCVCIPVGFSVGIVYIISGKKENKKYHSCVQLLWNDVFIVAPQVLKIHWSSWSSVHQRELCLVMSPEWFSTPAPGVPLCTPISRQLMLWLSVICHGKKKLKKNSWNQWSYKCWMCTLSQWLNHIWQMKSSRTKKMVMRQTNQHLKSLLNTVIKPEIWSGTKPSKRTALQDQGWKPQRHQIHMLFSKLSSP